MNKEMLKDKIQDHLHEKEGEWRCLGACGECFDAGMEAAIDGLKSLGLLEVELKED